MRPTLLSSLIASAALIGCAAQTPSSPVSSTQGSTWVQNGVVTDVRDTTENDGRNSVLGSLAGSLLGGLVGSQIGSGTGRAVAAVGGTAAGGLAGNSLGRASSARSFTRLTVRSENGESNTYFAEPGEAFKVGDQVKIVSERGTIRVTH